MTVAKRLNAAQRSRPLELGARCLGLAVALVALGVLFGFVCVAPAHAATPAKPVTTAPHGTVTAIMPTFTWSKATGASSYEVRVYRGSKLLVKQTGLKKLSWKSTKALPLYVALKWKVRGVSGRTYGAWSTNSPFKVDPNAPQGTITTRTPTFQWNKVAHATSYELRVYQGSKQLLKKTGIKKPSWKSTTSLPTYTNLTWKVRGVVARKARSWSKSFKIRIVPPATHIALNGGDAQTATTGTPVAVAPSVLVTDAWGHPVAGASVTFAVTAGGGSLTGATAVTNASGVATVGGWTLGTKAGANALTASAVGLSGSPVAFNASGVAGPADPDASTLAATTTTVTADGASTTTITVTITDAHGNPVDAGLTAVNVTLLTGTGTIGSVTDNGDGTYSAIVTAPTATGSGIFGATLNGIPVQSGGTSQAQVTVNYAPGPLDHFSFGAISGAQTAGTPFAVAITAYDAFGNVKTDYAGPATLSASTGDGTVSPTSVDFVDGVATPDVVLTKADGSVSLTISDGLVTTISGSPISVANAAADAVESTLTPMTTSLTANGSATQILTVQVKDAYGNDLTTGGDTVTITQLSGTGTIGAVTDNGDGTYSGTVTAPTATGNGVFVATLNGAPVMSGGATQVQATVNYVPGPLAKFVVSIASGQTAGVAFTGTNTVTAEDAYGNTVTAFDAGIDHVTISVSPNNGTISGLGSLGGNVLDRSLDFTNGVADLAGQVVFGGTAGNHTFTATSGIGACTGTSGIVTVTPAGASSLILSGLSAQTAGTAQSLTVTAKDAYGNTATGYTGTVHFTSTDTGAPGLPGNYAFQGSDAGVHSFTNGVTLKTSGSQTVTGTDTVTGTITGSQTVAVSAGSATQLNIETAANGSGTAITTKAVTAGTSFTGYAVTRDAYNNYVANPSATWSLTGTTGGVTGSDLSPASGTSSTFTGHLVGTATVHAVVGGLTDDTGIVTVSAGAATRGVLTTQPSGAVDGLALTGAPVVQLQDSSGNNVASTGVSIAATIGSGSGTLSGTTTVTTNASGAATFTNLVITGTIGSYTLTFTPASLTAATSSSFTLNIGAASKIALNAGDNQVAAPSAAVAVAPSVLVTDVGNNAVSGVGVTFAIGTGSGTLTGGSASTTASGIATVGSWTLGSIVGANTLTATSGSLSGSPVTFHATAIAIGSLYGGGVVAYFFQSGDTGYIPGQCHGLIAALADQGTGTVWAYGNTNQNTSVPGTSTAVGTGAANTTAIIGKYGAGTNYAAGLVRTYTGGGYSDWYLPSRDDLNELWQSSGTINGLSPTGWTPMAPTPYYWSSSEGDFYDAWQELFFNGSESSHAKSDTCLVRPVRSF
ncbi:MAG TPA: invasin domain 3-containing protein [Thermoleophilia bacterium]|nr:invasin domain 3-containing protein [Thermoleophilia bacterium]